MKNPTVHEIVKAFQLQPHIEGGYFSEDFKSDMILPSSFTGRGERAIITTCYYLIPKGERSIFHKLAADEIWTFLCGGPVDFYEISPDGLLTHTIVGPNFLQNQQLKRLVKKETWVGVIPQAQTEYAFFSAIVFPGFDYADWEKGEKSFLKTLCPNGQSIIDQLT